MTQFDLHKNFAIGTVLSAPSDASGEDFILMPGDGQPFGPNMPVTLCHDGLTLEDLILLDALPLRTTSTVEKLATVAGLSPESVRAGLGRLGLLGLAESHRGGWKRSSAAG